MGIRFAHCKRRENRRSLAILDRKEIAHLGAIKNRAILRGERKNRRHNRRESRDFDALSCGGTGSFEKFAAEVSASAPVVYENPPSTGPEVLGCSFLLTVGSFLLTVELFYLQLEASCLQWRFFTYGCVWELLCLQLEIFYLPLNFSCACGWSFLAFCGEVLLMST